MKKLAILGSIAGFYSIIDVLLIRQHRVPFGHDTFQYLQLQYLYYNEVVQHHALPLWFPFWNMGGGGNVVFTPQLNLLAPIIYLLGLFVHHLNYLDVFYGLLWFEELFFLGGVILLASLYYRDARTIFFVALTLGGTSIWYPQVWWNFHLFYFLPMVLYCFHACLTTGSFRYLLALILFFTLAVFGNFLYCIVFTSFVVLLYILLALLSDAALFRQSKHFLRTNFTLKKSIVLFLLLLLLTLSFAYIVYGGREIAYTNSTRDASGSNSLTTFLTYGGSLGLSKYKEFFTRYGNSIDINLYAGFLLLPFALIALVYVRKRIAFAVGGVAFIVFLFSIGVVVPYLFYYLYPLGKIFRHIGLTATVCKLFLVFYAGFGFEYFITRTSPAKTLALVILAYLAGLACLKPPVIDSTRFWAISENERVFVLLALYAALFLSILVFGLMCATKIPQKHLLRMLFLALLLDFFAYKYSLLVTRMPQADQRVIDLFQPYAYDFPAQRFFDTNSQGYANRRLAAFRSVPTYGSVYDTMESFFYTDAVKSSYRTDFVLQSVYHYAALAQRFPNNTQAVYSKYAGAGYPKLSVFAKLHVAADETVLGAIFAQDHFTGDMLFTTEDALRQIPAGIPANLLQRQTRLAVTNQNDRLPANIQIKEFTFNTLKLHVAVDGPAGEACVLYYADGYHPHWQAFVNGVKTQVIKANVGFKAIVIPYGQTEVTFRFGNWFYTLSMGCTLVLLAAVCGLTLVFLGNEMRKESC